MTDIDAKEPEAIGYIADPQEIKVEFIQQKVTEEEADFAINVIVKEAEHDREQVEQLFIGMCSTFTKIGMPHVVNSKKAGAGKSYLVNKVAEYFPSENVILLAGASAKAILHRNGTMVLKNEKTGKLEEVEPMIESLEDELEKIRQVEKKTGEEKSRIKDIEKEIKSIRKHQKKLINLENKIIVIQDTPQEAVIVNIMSLLSQDSDRDQEYSFNDIVGGKITPSANILRGMPVLFTTRVMDDTRNTRFEEINRRHINVTPNTSKEKIDTAVRLIVKDCSLLPEEYDTQIVSRKHQQKARDTIAKIVQNLIIIQRTLSLRNRASGYYLMTPFIVQYQRLKKMFGR